MDDNPSQPDLTQALLDAVQLFEAAGIRYALIGGLAAMVYGRARFTEDADFVASSNHQQVLSDHPKLMRRHGFDPGCTWKLYHHTGSEIDLWKDEFNDQIISRSVPVSMAGRTVQVADLHDLIAMKLRADRPQDDYDISEILKNSCVDDDTVQDRVSHEQFEAYLAIKKRIGLDG